MEITVEKLKELGLTQASNNLQEAKDFERKCAIAYEKFRYIKPERFVEFNACIKAKTLKSDKYQETYDRLTFTKLASYAEIPPVDVLTKLENARKENCFDYYEVAKIESVKELIDPILFGCINNCTDRFFVAQWGEDVKIEDILDVNEG